VATPIIEVREALPPRRQFSDEDKARLTPPFDARVLKAALAGIG
jgi:hypothetical protein